MSRPFEQEARRFLVYREGSGSAVNWDCSNADLAKSAGIDIRTVQKLCASPKWLQRGWCIRDRAALSEAQQRSGAQQHGVDQMMKSESSRRAIYDY